MIAAILAVFVPLWIGAEIKRRKERAGRIFAETDRDRILTMLREAKADADRLYPIVAQFVKDVDETAVLLKDPTPPALTAEREAIRLHQESLKLRT